MGFLEGNEVARIAPPSVPGCCGKEPVVQQRVCCAFNLRHVNRKGLFIGLSEQSINIIHEGSGWAWLQFHYAGRA